MKTLPTEFEKNGFHHKQLAREGDIALYRRHKPSINAEPHYEVVKIQRHHGYTVGNTEIPASETYPSSSQWGINGWTPHTEQEAWDKFNSLVSEAK